MQEVILTKEINGKTYQITRFDARTGSKLLVRLTARLIKLGSESANESSAATTETTQEENPAGLIQYLLLNLSDADFDYIQTAALSVINRSEGVDNDKFIPITRNGVIGAKDLKDDIGTIMELTSAAMIGNLSPFFTKAAIAKQMQIATAVSQE